MLERCQRFFDLHAQAIRSGDIDSQLRFYSLPLPLYFKGELIPIYSYRHLHEIFSAHARFLQEKGVDRLDAKVLSATLGCDNRLLCKVQWHYLRPGVKDVTDVTYYLSNMDCCLEIDMVSFDTAIPERLRDQERAEAV